MVRGVIFDMDGVLVDTEPFCHAQRLEFLRRMDYTPGDTIHRVGSNEPVIWAALVPESEQLRQEMLMGYHGFRRLHPTPYASLLNPEALELLAELKRRGVKTGIASSSPWESVDRMLETTGASDFIDCAVSGEDCSAYNVYNKRAAEKQFLPPDSKGDRIMPLVTSKELLLDAQKGGYAVGAFNVENLEMIQAVVSAAEELHSPVILQTTPSTVKYADLEFFYAMVKTAAEKAAVPVVMHLDHGNSFELAMRALRAGYTSIMIDGSHNSFAENCTVSKAVVDACHPSSVPVEAELGKVGGKEDDLNGGDGDPYTDPREANAFVEATGVDSLAVAIGTAHGVYKGVPKLDLERLSEIRKVVSIPLVLHGTSGVPDDTVRECIRRGICKVNYATDLRIAFSKGVNAVLIKDPNVFDPKKYNAQGREEVKVYVKEKIKVCNSAGRA